MVKFNTSKNKLKNIWNDVKSNINKIYQKPNQDKINFFNNLSKQQNFKVPIEIYNSEKILTPVLINDAKSALKSELMPMSTSYFEMIDLEIPEFFLPFVKYSTQIKSSPPCVT